MGRAQGQGLHSTQLYYCPMVKTNRLIDHFQKYIKICYVLNFFVGPKSNARIALKIKILKKYL